METAEIARRWLAFFEEKGHAVVPSAPLPFDDPNLLFVVAGMVPFVPYFSGQQTPPWPRAASVQKCVRTPDLDEVGKTSRHGTFFQMNGNFSFGDYFKRDAIAYAWELLTGPVDAGRYGLDPEKLWATVYEDDDEAEALWLELTDIPKERIVRRDRLDNYWHMGIPGPGGPCSEIFYDRGPQYGPEGGPTVDEDRYMEIWNLVFTEFELGAVRSKADFDIVGPLPKKNVDTGMGLERIASVLQGVDNLYEIDQVRPVLDRAAEMTGKRYGAVPSHVASQSSPDDVRLRVVADHVRSCLMLIGDGVTPGNEGRGYVLRRMLRRAVRSMRLLGWDEPAMPHLLPISMERMSATYPELRTDFDRISQVAYAEEEAFRRTLASGTTILDTAVARAKSAAPSRPQELHRGAGVRAARHLRLPHRPHPRDGGRAGRRRRRGRVPPPDAGAEGPGPRRRRRPRSRPTATPPSTGGSPTASAGRSSSPATTRWSPRAGSPASSATARTSTSPVPATTSSWSSTAPRSTPRAAASWPTAAASSSTTARSSRCATSSPRSAASSPTGRRWCSARSCPARSAQSEVDIERRKSISRAHTGTHMVHKAIREALGDTATQAGSENAPGRFRFDFNAQSAVPKSVLRDVEAKVNALLLDDLPVTAEVMTQQQARDSGAMALFGEKYGDAVRVISVGDWARELCGGTHAQRSGQLGVVKLLGESSIGSGVRRVEALVGVDAYSFLAREHAIVGQLTEALQARPEELPERVAGILGRLKEAEREIAAARQEKALGAAAGLVSSARDFGGVALVTHDAGDLGADDLRTLVLDVRNRMGADRSAVVAMASAATGRPVIVVGHDRWGPSGWSDGRAAGADRRPGPGRRRWRQGRPRAGWWHRPVEGVRGPRCGRGRGARSAPADPCVGR